MQSNEQIWIRGARQNNLKGFDLALPLGKLTVVSGPSGSGKSSLAFDTVYAEGQRRYLETFSPYARQFLERMDRPQADGIEGIPPAIAIQATNQVKTSRSTVGTMTEICDYVKLLWPRLAVLHCGRCGKVVRPHTPPSVWEEVWQGAADAVPVEILICFTLARPRGLPAEQIATLLRQQGFHRLWWDGQVRSLDESLASLAEGGSLVVVQDRLVLAEGSHKRFIESCEAAFQFGKGRLQIIFPTSGRSLLFSCHRYCADCDLTYREPTSALFSFNNPLGACPRCRGFGRTIEIDYDLCLPDKSLSIAQGVVRPWQSGMSRECQDDLLRFCRKRGVPTDVPFRDLPAAQQRWVIEGDPDYGKDAAHRWPHAWYGLRGFFAWLEGRAYKMHVRVFLSRYRAYRRCAACGGGRFIPEALNWKVDGLSLADFYALPVSGALRFLGSRLSAAAGGAGAGREAVASDPAALLGREVLARLQYLEDVGLGYLTLDRQSRTLSGGEVERVNLTTALGTSLVNTLFVLDEPSVGLHPRDVDRLIGVLHRLRDHGNTLLVVEHDESVIRAADHVVDLGPGAGEGGGRVVFAGPPHALSGCAESLTAQYLRGEKTIPVPARRRPWRSAITIRGASENNLRDVDVTVPLQVLVCVTGVSGSGKSTLVEQVLYRNLCRLQGRAVEEPGRCRRIEGHESLGPVVLVDQSPIGRTTRSNPAVYVGAFDLIRELFASTETARRAGIGAGDFSFNSGHGRCERCGGNGFERVEMQFLSDVYLRCPDCEGTRFKPHVLDVRYRDRSIADVLALTVEEACEFFADQPRIVQSFQSLRDVGLGYLRLGQPLPTLSGGESQRLKIVGHLLERKTDQTKPTLFLFDEPTTGLHFDDIRMLLGLFQRLVEQGHSVVLIEHNVDVIRCADWVIDLGPEAGDDGGRVVCAGTPEEVARCEASHTGRALRASGGPHRTSREARPAGGGPAGPARGAIRIIGAREHNLKNLTVDIPRDRLVVITGISGSGKSTLAFDVLFAEGQRRFLDSMSAYARQFIEQLARPDVDHIEGIPPAAAIEQRLTSGGRKSTVATVTEAYHYLRLLFAKLGVQYCPGCAVPVEPQSPTAIARRVATLLRRGPIHLLAPLLRGRKGFGLEAAEWARKQGFNRLRVDGEWVEAARFRKLDRYREHDVEVDFGRLEPRSRSAEVERAVALALEAGQGQLIARGRGGTETFFSTQRTCPRCGRSFPEPDPKLFSFHSPRGWCPACHGYGTRLVPPETEEEQQALESREDWSDEPCPACGGRRLNEQALAVRLPPRGWNLATLCGMSVAAAQGELQRLRWKGQEQDIAAAIVPPILERLRFLQEVGLGYLGLDRSAHTLSGGESQRIRLAAQLGSELRGVLYVLDEPTIGLHPRDNARLLATLDALKARGNSLVVVEHDEMTMRHADHIIDLGPGAGVHGGRVVASGPLSELQRHPESLTGRCLREPMRHPIRGTRRPVSARQPWLTLHGARLHNLKNLTARFPLGRFTCVTGVSGSGKSTLVREALLGAVRAALRGEAPPPELARRLTGGATLRAAYEVDQSPIGKTPRSTPATYTGLFDGIRRLFALTPLARMRGYGPSRFSFNSPAGGRCPRCEGQGRIRVAMNFLPDVYTPCEACGGSRYDEETLDVKFRDKNIAQVLAMSVDEAVEFFAAHRRVHRPLELLQQSGLGYLTLGQTSPTLSGGEAQRLKLVTELARVPAAPAAGRGLLYVLEEPTIGLHMADIRRLIEVLQRLVDAGHTVVVIEHNLDLVAEADWVLDLGPEGGEDGGRIVAEGTPETVARCPRSHTGRFLRGFLAGFK